MEGTEIGLYKGGWKPKRKDQHILSDSRTKMD